MLALDKTSLEYNLYLVAIFLFPLDNSSKQRKIWAHASNGRDTPGHWEYKGYYLDEGDVTNHDDTLMRVVTSYLSPTRTLAPTEPVAELSVPTAFGPILAEVENETGANLTFKSADDTSDGGLHSGGSGKGGL